MGAPRITLVATTLALASIARAGGSGPAPAPAPCANPGIRDGARRTLRDASVTASALVFCTGEDCWSLDATTSKIAAIPAVKPVPPASDTPGTSADGRASATPTEVAFCPSGPTSCKRFNYKFAFQPQGGLHPMINAAGTLGAVIYAGAGEANEPRYLLAYDLAAGKLIKQVALKANDAEVLRTGFLFNQALHSARLKKLAALALPGADRQAIAGTDLIALSNAEHGTLVIQDAATGKARRRIKLGSQGIDQVLASPDGARLYVITQGKTEGEVVMIDVAGNRIAGRAAPAACAAGTTRAR
jgi:hypothetical protein